jgi:hypothetical protein
MEGDIRGWNEMIIYEIKRWLQGTEVRGLLSVLKRIIVSKLKSDMRKKFPCLVECDVYDSTVDLEICCYGVGCGNLWWLISTRILFILWFLFGVVFWSRGRDVFEMCIIETSRSKF